MELPYKVIAESEALLQEVKNQLVSEHYKEGGLEDYNEKNVLN